MTSLRERVRSTSGGRIAWRIGATVGGVAVVIIGIVLLPLPGPGWVIGAADLSHLRTAAPVVSTRFFDTPRTFVTGVGPTALGALGMPTAVPTQSFASAGALISAVDTGRLRPGTRAVVYAAAHSGSTPLAEQRHLARFYRLAGQAAHAHGLLFIAAPAANLVAALAPHTPASRQDSAFLRLRIAAQWQKQDLITVRDLAASGALDLGGLISHRAPASSSMTAPKARSSLQTPVTAPALTSRHGDAARSKASGKFRRDRCNLPHAAYGNRCGKSQRLE